MRAVIDSSSWISLARSGLLDLLHAASVEPVLLDVVRAEIVEEGRRGGHADAAILATAVAAIPVTATQADDLPDARVLEGARQIGVLIANDLALGRRARSVGISWIRTADLLILGVKKGSMSSADGMAGLRALEASGRISTELAETYEELLT